MIVYRIKAITGIYDFTLAADPAYPDTSVEAREFATALKQGEEGRPEKKDLDENLQKQLREMRRAAKQSIF